jgi:hypothetical protein
LWSLISTAFKRKAVFFGLEDDEGAVCSIIIIIFGFVLVERARSVNI